VVRAALSPGAKIDRFEIVALLGRGGMGAVYEARDPGLGRMVALKVIAEPEAQLSLRLVREAQALAQLQHPNVVAVHEVGTDGDEVFVAMELVDGTSLDRLSPRPATWRETVALFVQAGRGLVAAHAKDLVHRDIKPSNIFVGRDGRVRVGDFGLARRAPAEGTTPGEVAAVVAAMSSATTLELGSPIPPMPAGVVPAEGMVDASLTHEGAVLGTPKYMAPEQLAGGRATAQSDQYSFCVALEEMLPAGARPAWLVRAIERGRARDPARRHASLAALIDLLEETPRRRRRLVVAVGAVAAAAALAVGVAFAVTRGGGAAGPPPCANGPERMAGVWDDARRAAAAAAFTATKVPYADAAFARIAAELDDRRAEWLAMYREACEATEVHRTQSPDMLDRRMSCLDERRLSVGAFVDRLVAIEAKGVDNAEVAAGDVARVEACADTDRLARGARAPNDPTERARYDALRGEMARLKASIAVGDWKTLATDAAALAEEADRHGWRGIVGQARYYEGQAISATGESPRARVVLEKAAQAAADAGDDEIVMAAWLLLVPTLSEAGDLQAARTLLTAADASVRRYGNRPRFRAELMQSEGWITALDGDLRGGKAIFERALALLEAEAPNAINGMIQSLANLASVETQLGLHADAIAHRQRVVTLSSDRYGALHPTTADAYAELGQATGASGDRAGARAILVEALATMEKVYGPDSPRVAVALQTLANAQDDSRLALPYYERAVAIHEKAGTAGLGRALVGLAQTQIELNDKAGARATLERAFPVIEKRLGTDSIEYAAAESAYGMAVGCSAKARLDHAITILTAQIGPDHGLTQDAVATRKPCLGTVEPSSTK
jgi:eukaryotic-like serine/threonine-protein kinase